MHNWTYESLRMEDIFQNNMLLIGIQHYFKAKVTILMMHNLDRA